MTGESPTAPPFDPYAPQPVPPQTAPPPPQPYYTPQPPAQTEAPPSKTDDAAQKASAPPYYAPAPNNLSNNPVVLTCSQCHHRGPSTVTSDNCTAVNWICTLTLCLCCFFCIPATAKHTHTCSNCGGYLGSNNMV
ncbi:hypothetical protein BWQ96_08912 [Gracilariopsis chorda]|uniref:LITAF domain-containing protein n=1 Tax=Gracilariopsis chorda TaxID=448386 RepID=A0A2V3IH53_9FLOR|nr:hypothetical protein BWQ96_08912 [Gracilariopsis chorda]|eukprot:PXF41414.1 hypothetical protein BWQ96_08912 [Gracilariopsis chorda]